MRGRGHRRWWRIPVPALVVLFVVLAGPDARADDPCDACRVTLKPLDLSRAPSDLELVRSGQLGGALSPLTHASPAGAADRLLFGSAMDAWNRHDYKTASTLFKAHRAQFPSSAWSGEAELHLGCQSRFSGRYAEAQAYFSAIRTACAARGEPDGDIARKADLRLAMLAFMRGDFDKAEAMWQEMEAHDPDRRRRDHARHWLMRASLYRREARWVRRCAVESLAHLMRQAGKAEAARALDAMPANPKYGFRADELVTIAGQVQFPLTGVRLQSPANLPLPCIAHYGFNHFVAVLRRDEDGNLVIFDPILNHTVTMSDAEFSREWSGVALTPKAKAPRRFSFRRSRATGTLLSMRELAAFTGGCCGVENVNRDEGCNPCDQVGGDSGGGFGMPAWGFNPISMNVFMTDTPLWYQPPVGPGIAFTMSYNSIDADVNLPSFGDKWNFAYNSYAIQTPASGVGTVTVFMPDGRNDVYSPDGTNFTAPARSFSVLTQTGAHDFTLTFPDGAVWTYGSPLGATNVHQALLTQLADRHGNAVTLVYDGEEDPRLSRVVDAVSQTSHIYYAASGLITNITDPFGRAASYAYGEDGRLAAITDMGGVVSPLSFHTSGQNEDYLKTLRTRDGLVTFDYEHQSAAAVGMWRRQRITATYTNGDTEVLYYNGGEGGQVLTTFTDRTGKTTRYKLGLNVAFPFQGSIVYEEAADGTRVDYAYDAALQPTNIVDEAGQVWRLDYNAQGELTVARQPNGYEASMTYTNGGRDLWTLAEGTNQLLALMYNAARDVTMISNAVGQVTRFQYAGDGRLTNAVDALGVTNVYAYGADRRLTQVQRAGATLLTLAYDQVGRVTNAVGPDGLAVTTAHDALDRPTALTLADAGTYRWTYQTNSLLLDQAIDRSGRRIRYGYDALNRLTLAQGPDQSQIRFVYDGVGNLRSVTDPEARSYRFDFDTRHRPIAASLPDGTTNRVSYTSRGLLETATGARAISGLFGYDLAGLLTNATYSDGTAGQRFVYDTRNRLTVTTDGWSTNTLTYDALGRLTRSREVQSGYTQSLDYAYNALGLVSAVSLTAGTNAAFSTAYAYDSLGRLTNVTVGAQRFSYTYLGNGGRVATLRYGTFGTATYAYDGLRRLTNVAFNSAPLGPAVGDWRYTYDSRDFLATSRTSNGVTNRYRYDEAGRLTEAQSESGGVMTGYPRRYYYDGTGNRVRQTEGTQTRSARHTPANALLSLGRSNEVSLLGYVTEAGTGTTVQVRSDSATNWVTVATRYLCHTQAWFEAYGVVVTNAGANNTLWVRATDRSGNASTQTVSVVNAATNQPFAYDLDGNRTNGASAYAWDALNRLTRITYGDGSETRLRYDGAGRLREVAEHASTGLVSVTRYAWSGWLPLAELDVNNTPRKSFIWGLDVSGTVGGAGGIGGLLAVVTPSGLSYVRTDGKGNVAAVCDSASWSVQDTYRYGPYGEVLEATGSGQQPFRHQTKLAHAKSGLIYYGFRWYEPATGVWLSRDPLGLAGGMNLYQYCAGNPVNYGDPDGLAAETFVDIGSIGYSGYALFRDPSWGNAGYLGWDVVAAIIPGVPGSYSKKGISALYNKCAKFLSKGDVAAKSGGRAFRVMTEEELAGAKLGQYADSPYMNPSQAGKKWVWQTEEQAAKWKALMERGGEKPVITEIPTTRPLDAYEAFPHETPSGPAYLVPIEELGPANPLNR